MPHTRDYLDYLHDSVSITPAGSQEELEASQLVQRLMEQHKLDTTMEEFTTPARGQLFHDLLYITLFVGAVLAGLLGTAISVIGVVLAAASATLLFMEASGRPVVSQLGPRATSQNVIGVHRASGPLVTRGIRPIVIVAHVDAPQEGLLYSDKFARFQPLIRQLTLPCTSAALACCVLQLFTFIPAALLHILWLIGVISGLPLLLRAIACIYDMSAAATPGSNDNKSGLAALLGIMDMVHPAEDEAKAYLAEHPHQAPQLFVPGEQFDEDLPEETAENTFEEYVAAPAPEAAPVAETLPTIEPAPAEVAPQEAPEPLPVQESVPAAAEAELVEPEVAPVAEEVTTQPEPAFAEEAPEDVVPQFIYHGDTAADSDSVRRGSDFLQSLGILPPECEIVYDRPTVPEVEVVLPEIKIPTPVQLPELSAPVVTREEETAPKPEAQAFVPAAANDYVEPAVQAEDLELISVQTPAEEQEVEATPEDGSLELIDVNPYLRTKVEYAAVDAEFVEVTDEEESDVPFVKTRFDKFLDLFKKRPKAQKLEEEVTPEIAADEPSELASKLETVAPQSELEEILPEESEVQEELVETPTSELQEIGELEDEVAAELEHEAPVESESEEVAATETEEEPEAPATPEATAEVQTSTTDKTSELPHATLTPQGIYTSEPEPSSEELSAKDSGGLKVLDADTTSALQGPDVKPNPEPVEDPKWGTAEFKPQAPNRDFARRAMLFDLPDPLQKGTDPLQQKNPSASGRLTVIEGEKGKTQPTGALRPDKTSGGVRLGASDTGMGAPTPVTVTKEPVPGGAHKPEAIGFITKATTAQTSAHNMHAKPQRQAKAEKKGLFPGIFGRRKDDQESMGQWLGVEEDFDAKSGGAAIGNWDNFSDESKKDDSGKWKGGATSSSDAQAAQQGPRQAEGYELGSQPSIEDGFQEQTRDAEPGFDPAYVAETLDAEPQGATMDDIEREELRASILGMGDDALIAHDIWFVATGASSYNNAGIKDFLANHRRDVRGAFVINLESIGAGYLSILTKEGETNPKNIDRRIARLLQRTAKDLHIELGSANFGWTQTDATPCMQANMRSATIIGLSDDGVPALSHTSADTEANLEPAQIVDVADLVAEFIRRS